MIPSKEHQSSSEPSDDEGVHTGYDLESGVLARVREWTDVFPWLRLGRTLRVVGSPPLLLLTAVTWGVWFLGASFTDQELQINQDAQVLVAWANTPVSRGGMRPYVMLAVSSFVTDVVPASLFGSRSGSFWGSIVALAWTLFVWTPTALMLARQGALLTAGRPMIGFTSGMLLSARRTPVAWLLAVVPLACVLVIGLAILISGWVSGFSGWMEWPMSVVVALVAIPCGMLAFGANVAVPIGWAALSVEKEPDLLDSLSRGYEYLYRRPLQLVVYALVATVTMTIVVLLTREVAAAATEVSEVILATAGAGESMLTRTSMCLRLLPVVAALTLFWALVGGTYLLLRQDAGSQHVEDIWQPPTQATEPLPELAAR